MLKRKTIIFSILSLCACHFPYDMRIDFGAGPDDRFKQCVNIEASKVYKDGRLFSSNTEGLANDIANYCFDRAGVADEEITYGGYRVAYGVLRGYIKKACLEYPCTVYDRLYEVDYTN